MINVTKTYLPDIDKYKEYVNEIYASGWVTNNGPLIQKLEQRLAKYLGVKNIVLVANGTAALEVAYRTLELKGSAITTPFSFVATTSSLVTNGISPIFTDINPHTLTLDPDNLNNLMDSNISAIVPVHVFGNGCEVEKIEDFSKRNGVKVVYDASHAFNVKFKGKSILNYGDISTLSFHATKLFHTIEGGALILKDENLVSKAKYLINFGIENEEAIPDIGINAKMNEFEAAMGLCMLDEMEKILVQRRNIFKFYEKELANILTLQKLNENVSRNYSFFPIICKCEKERLKVQKALNANNIFPRRYFFPSLDTLNYIKNATICEISRDISKRVLCLPLYPGLNWDSQLEIITLIKANLL